MPMINGSGTNQPSRTNNRSSPPSLCIVVATISFVLWACIYQSTVAWATLSSTTCDMHLSPHVQAVALCFRHGIVLYCNTSHRVSDQFPKHLCRWKEKGNVFYYKIHLLGESLWPWHSFIFARLGGGGRGEDEILSVDTMKNIIVLNGCIVK